LWVVFVLGYITGYTVNVWNDTKNRKFPVFESANLPEFRFFCWAAKSYPGYFLGYKSALPDKSKGLQKKFVTLLKFGYTRFSDFRKSVIGTLCMQTFNTKTKQKTAIDVKNKNSFHPFPLS
jgi:hypothetical protein